MREATMEERKGVSDYIEKISENIGCEYCIEEKIFYNPCNPDIEFRIGYDFGYPTLYVDDGNSINRVDIKYCPKCGRKLK